MTDSDKLFNAVRKGDQAEVCRLLEQGADVNAMDYNGRMELTEAEENGHTDIVRIIRQYKQSDMKA